MLFSLVGEYHLYRGGSTEWYASAKLLGITFDCDILFDEEM